MSKLVKLKTLRETIEVSEAELKRLVARGKLTPAAKWGRVRLYDPEKAKAELEKNFG